MRSAAASSMWLPSVSILSETPAAVSRSKSFQQCGTPSGSPPPKATEGMPKAAMHSAMCSASALVSSSAQALSGPDSSQQAMQREPQRFVSCQARKGARDTLLPERPSMRVRG